MQGVCGNSKFSKDPAAEEKIWTVEIYVQIARSEHKRKNI
jgi:hypothetical protein